MLFFKKKSESTHCDFIQLMTRGYSPFLYRPEHIAHTHVVTICLFNQKMRLAHNCFNEIKVNCLTRVNFF